MSNQLFKLRRYNGKSHSHTNKIEKNSMYNFHIHTATQRYQKIGMKEESYAEETTRYADLRGAINCLIADCGFVLPPELQMEMVFSLERE